MVKKTGATLISDGWSSVSNFPIVNVLLLVFGVAMLREAVDTSGLTKTGHFIADLLGKRIVEIGEAYIAAVCMDGACKIAMKIIK